MSIHEHQWCYHGELLLAGASTHRQEWCVACGTVRVHINNRWYYQYPDSYREKYDTEESKNSYLGVIPERAFAKKEKRLGRGLKEIRDQEAVGNLLRLFPKGA